MKNLFLLFIGIAFLCVSCDPFTECTDPKCGTSPATFKFKGNLNDTNKVLHLGDTLKMRLKIPDTLSTNIGQYSVSSVQYGYVAVDYYRIDTIIDKSTGKITTERFSIKKGKLAAQSSAVEFDYISKEIELHFIPTEKGKYYIQFSPQSSRLEFTDKSGKKLFVMMNTSLDVKDTHIELYLSWIGDVNTRNEARISINNLAAEGIGRYAFLVN